MSDSNTPALDAWNAKYGTASPEQRARNLERLRSDARHNEASAIGHAKRREAAKWQGMVVELDETIAANERILSELLAKLDERGLSDGRDNGSR